jgi:hypothetical protein
MKLWVLCLVAISASAQAGAPVFRTEARLVEVPLTVVDNKGRMQTGLPQDRFEVLEDGRPRPIATFESTAADLSIAILLDTTGSMQEALPGVKRSINQFIDRLRPNDSVAVFTFSSTLQEQQDFTRDKSASQARGVTDEGDGIYCAVRRDRTDHLVDGQAEGPEGAGRPLPTGRTTPAF